MKLDDRPDRILSEFTFAGRSNVGKSSLINTLLNRKNFARISKTPGKTRSINYFLINNSFYFVDLPGYGFARVSKDEKKKWQTAIENYILENKQIRTIFILIDGIVGPQEKDRQLIEWLQFHKIDFVIIVTKIDRINNNQKAQITKNLKQTLNLDKNFIVILFSAKTKEGKEKILALIENLL
jgi:GTP-binding protein